MSMTPASLIADAELMAFPFGGPNVVAPGALLRVITQLEREVVGLLLLESPERLSVPGTDIPVVAASNATGYTLIYGEGYTDFKWLDTDGVARPIRIVPESRFDDPPVHPAGIVRGSKFYPCDPLQQRWVTTEGRSFFTGSGDVIAYRYVADTAAVTTMTQALVSPDEAQPYIQWALVLTILLAATQAGQAVSPETMQRTVSLMNDAKAGFLLAASKRAG